MKVYGNELKIKENVDILLHEMADLIDLEHNNLIRYYGVELKEGKESTSYFMEGIINFLVVLKFCVLVDIIMEYASGGSVWGLIRKFFTLEERVIRYYTRQILEGLSHLHSQGFLHMYKLVWSNSIIYLGT